MVTIVVKSPKYRTAKQLVSDGTFPISQTTLLIHARRNGIGRKLGRTVMFSESDVEKLYEAGACPSKSFAALKHLTGYSAAPSAESVLKKLQAQLTKPLLNKSGLSAKLKS